MPSKARVFLTGGTGFMGRRLAGQLTSRGHHVRALVRPGSERRAPAVDEVVVADPLDGDSYARRIGDADTFIHLIGTPHPAPWKAKQFEAIDLVSAQAAVDAAARSGAIRHFVYVSVAHPAPVMKAYIRVREQAEAYLAASGIPHTILRPWYVLGPGRRWAILLKPFYWLGESFQATRAQAQRMGFLTESEMINALVWSVEHPLTGARRRILEVPAIRMLNSPP